MVLKNNQYHVKLPWYEDKIKDVSSNHRVALAVMNRVEKTLKIKNLEAEYSKVFSQQLKDGIIEKIVISPSEYENFIWIPIGLSSKWMLKLLQKFVLFLTVL